MLTEREIKQLRINAKIHQKVFDEVKKMLKP
jgi:methionine aminopeptidase